MKLFEPNIAYNMKVKIKDTEYNVSTITYTKSVEIAEGPDGGEERSVIVGSLVIDSETNPFTLDVPIDLIFSNEEAKWSFKYFLPIGAIGGFENVVNSLSSVTGVSFVAARMEE